MDIVGFLLAGFAGGIIGGMGMGGGTLLIPILTLTLAMPQLEAQAINLISFLPMAVLSLVLHFKNKLVKIKPVLIMTPLAIAGCIGGAYLTRIVDAYILRKVFGYFLLTIGVLYMGKAIMDIVLNRLNNHR